MRIVQLFLVVLALAGVAAMVVLAPGAVGSTHQSTHRLADPGVASQSLAPDSMVWDVVTS